LPFDLAGTSCDLSRSGDLARSRIEINRRGTDFSQLILSKKRKLGSDRMDAYGNCSYNARVSLVYTWFTPGAPAVVRELRQWPL
jgi:hypothetical protein